MHIEENAQRNFRKHILESNLQKHKINFPEIKTIYGSPLNYRARVQLCDGGFAEKNSNKNVVSCFLYCFFMEFSRQEC